MLRESKTVQMKHDSAVVKGEPVIKEGFVMVPLNSGEANELIAYGVEGSFGFKKATGTTLKVGDKAYYKSADKTVTHEKTSNEYIGRVVDIGSFVEVKINV